MKKIIFLPIIALLFSCANSSDEKKVVPSKNLMHFQKMYVEYYKKADHNLSTGLAYYRMTNFDLERLTDTISKVNAEIFQNEDIRTLVNEDISNWLRDYVFIGSSKKMKGDFMLDTTNMLTLEKPSEYYSYSKIKQGQKIYNKLFLNTFFKRLIEIDGKKIYYYIRPANGKLLEEIAEYRIKTSGDYLPIYEKKRNKIYDRRYLCDLYRIDWYVLISSDDFFNDKLAFKITDTTYYYNEDYTRQK